MEYMLYVLQLGLNLKAKIQRPLSNSQGTKLLLLGMRKLMKVNDAVVINSSVAIPGLP